MGTHLSFDLLLDPFVIVVITVLLLLTRIPFSAAADGVLFTSSVTYCNPPESLLVQQFDIKYFNSNQSIFFNVSAASAVRIPSCTLPALTAPGRRKTSRCLQTC